MKTKNEPQVSGEKQEKKPGTFDKNDPRINREGRPVGSRDPLKEIGLRIAKMQIAKGIPVKQQRKLRKMGIDIDQNFTMLESIMIELATSGNPAKLQMYLERTFGKVANVNMNYSAENIKFEKYRKKFTSSELEEIASGANWLEMLLDKIPDIDEDEDEET